MGEPKYQAEECEYDERAFFASFVDNFIPYQRLGDLDWMGGAMSGTVYNSSHELGTLMTEVKESFCSSAWLVVWLVGGLIGSAIFSF